MCLSLLKYCLSIINAALEQQTYEVLIVLYVFSKNPVMKNGRNSRMHTLLSYCESSWDMQHLNSVE
jgi:hypothetical protein